MPLTADFKAMFTGDAIQEKTKTKASCQYVTVLLFNYYFTYGLLGDI